MVKVCDDSIKKPLSIIYKNCVKTGIYPNAWKKSNIVPVHEKKIEDALFDYLSTHCRMLVLGTSN